MVKINQKIVRELFDYQNGFLLWRRNRRGGVKVGDIAGYKRKDGYIVVGINGSRNILAHRVIWLYHYGYLPENGIDHIDQDKSNNKINNLREATQSCNMRNIGNIRTNTSGVKGVTFSNAKRRWVAQITIKGKNKVIGRGKDFVEMVAIRYATEQCIGWNRCETKSPAHIFIKNYYSYANRSKLSNQNNQ